MNIITVDRFLTIRCKAFAGQGVRLHRIMVDADTCVGRDVTRGAVRVWDDLCGHFTACHSISEKAVQRIRQTFQP
jgi:hypothetical protein